MTLLPMGPPIAYLTPMKWLGNPHVWKHEQNTMEMSVHRIIKQMGKTNPKNQAKIITFKKWLTIKPNWRCYGHPPVTPPNLGASFIFFFSPLHPPNLLEAMQTSFLEIKENLSCLSFNHPWSQTLLHLCLWLMHLERKRKANDEIFVYQHFNTYILFLLCACWN